MIVPCTERLTEAENRVLFRCTAADPRRRRVREGIIQLLLSERNRWVHIHSGILCILKDRDEAAFLLTIIDVTNNQIVFNQRINLTTMHFQRYHKLICFVADWGSVLRRSQNNLVEEGDQCMMGLSFAFDNEAADIYDWIQQKLTKEQHILQPKKNQFQLNLFGSNNKKRISKANIGSPADFEHLTHIDFDGITVHSKSSVTPEIFEFLRELGFSSKQIQSSKSEIIKVTSLCEARRVEKEKRRPKITQKADPPNPLASVAIIPPPPPPQMAENIMAKMNTNLMEQIRLGTTLNKTAYEPETTSLNLTVPQIEPSLGELLMKVMDQFRESSASSDEDPENVDDEWH